MVKNKKDAKFCSKCGTNMQEPANINNNISIKDYLSMIIATILKPSTSLKEEIDKFNNIKNSAISTIVSLIKTMFDTIIVKDYS